MSASDGPSKSKPSSSKLVTGHCSITEVVEELGSGPAQLRVSLLTGFVSVFIGAESLVFTSATDIITREWGLTPVRSGVLVGIFFVGLFFGSFAGGALGDRHGRKLSIVLAYSLVTITACASVVATGFWSLSAFRFLIGFSCGVGGPGQTALLTETSPSGSRLACFAISCGMFSVGEIYMTIAMILDDPYIVNLHWRTLTVVAGLPGILVALLSMAFLPQSPCYLADRGDYEEAMEVVNTLRNQNGLPDIPVKLVPETGPSSPTEITFSRQLRTVFGPRLFLATCIVCWLDLCVDGLHFGTMTAFAKALYRGVGVGGSPAVSLLLGTMSEIAGAGAALLCVSMPRKPALFFWFGVEALAMAIFAIAATREHLGPGMQCLATMGFHITKLANQPCAHLSFLYTSEVYPTSSRALGTAIALGASRIVAALAPNAVELVVQVATVDTFFWITSSMHIVGMVLIVLLPFETYGKPLQDDGDKQVEQYGATG